MYVMNSLELLLLVHAPPEVWVGDRLLAVIAWLKSAERRNNSGGT
jgi:hypothetical protein